MRFSRRDTAYCVRHVQNIGRSTLRPYVFVLLLAGCAPQNAPQVNVSNTPSNIEYSKSSDSTNQIVVGQFLDGKTPLALRFKEMSSDWKRIEINIANSDKSAQPRENNDRFPIQLLRETTGARPGFYFTQWKTVAQNDDTFLVCYRAPDFDDSDIRALFTAKNEYLKPNASQFMSAISMWMDERPLDFVLLNLKNAKVISNAQAVNWSQSLDELRAWADKNLSSEASARLSSRERLQLLANATLRFARDNNGVLPTLDNEKILQKEMSRLVFDPIWWRKAGSDKMFASNAVLTNKKIAHISAPADMILFYERDANANGARNVAFLDGSARELNADDWEKYRRGSKIP